MYRRKNIKYIKKFTEYGLTILAFLLILASLNSSEGNDDLTDVMTTEVTTKISLRNDIFCKILQYNCTPYALAGSCDVSNNGCKLTCKKTKSEHALIDKLENQYKSCKKPMELLLYETNFEESTFGIIDLNGNFELAYLSIERSSLEKILDNAFDKASLKNLETLKIHESEIMHMNDKTFAGLKNLKILNIRNIVQAKGEISATAVLKPLATTIIELYFIHKSTNIEKNEPGNWLQNADFMQLKKVDFLANYFPNTLNRNSFKNLKSVESLSLQSCAISDMEDETFDAILSTLRFLDLSNNDLSILSSHFVTNAINSNFELVLTGNKWDCSCKNYDLIEAIKNEKIQIKLMPICTRPIEYFHKDLSTVNLCCIEECNSTTIATTAETKTTTITSEITKSTENFTFSTETTTVQSINIIKLSCKSWTSNEETITHAVKNQLTYFDIKTFKSTNVIITVNNKPDNAGILYFNSYDHQDNNMNNVEALNHKSIIIENLMSNLSYTFCLVNMASKLISPFDCRSHAMDKGSTKKIHEVWLASKDIPIFLTLTAIGAIIFSLIGLISCFLLLRWRPTLLCSKRLIQLEPQSKKVILYKNAEIYEDFRTYSSSDELNPDDYVKYLRSTQLPTTKIEGVNNSEIQPPTERAPALPPVRGVSSNSTQSQLTTVDNLSLHGLSVDFNEHDYQSLHDYQRIYGENINK